MLRWIVAMLVMTQLAVILLHYMGLLDMYAVSAWVSSLFASALHRLLVPF